MFQNGQTHFKNLAAHAARFLKCAWPFWDIMHQKFKHQPNFGNETHDFNCMLNVLQRTLKSD